MIRNLGKLMLLVLVLAFVWPILPYALALAQDTIASSTPADTAKVVKDTVLPWGGLLSTIVGAIVAAVLGWFGSHHGAKTGVQAAVGGKVPPRDRF